MGSFSSRQESEASALVPAIPKPKRADEDGCRHGPSIWNWTEFVKRGTSKLFSSATFTVMKNGIASGCDGFGAITHLVLVGFALRLVALVALLFHPGIQRRPQPRNRGRIRRIVGNILQLPRLRL